MKGKIENILNKSSLSREDIVVLLSTYNSNECHKVFSEAYRIKQAHIGKKVALRGLIEYSNHCRKNCLYCGIRSGNNKISRYNLTHDEVIEACSFAMVKGFGSLVIQSGERCSEKYVLQIGKLLKDIKDRSDGRAGITLSCGEQSEEVYRYWFECGAHRYLLRIESSNRELFEKIHPANRLHDYDTRLKCLKSLRDIGYQVGTGVMIGLPGQRLEDLADDILFIRDMDIDMVGMGPYLEHADTPMYQEKDRLLPINDRLNLGLLMIAVLRIVMKDINIASSTALHAIDPDGREKGLLAGANVIMPNITPAKYRDAYLLYDGKQKIIDERGSSIEQLEIKLRKLGEEILNNEWGDSRHFMLRNS